MFLLMVLLYFPDGFFMGFLMVSVNMKILVFNSKYVFLLEKAGYTYLPKPLRIFVWVKCIGDPSTCRDYHLGPSTSNVHF
jgi:hypothetical protein